MPLNDVIFEKTKLQKLDWDIMNMFQLESFNITMFSQLRDTAMMYGLPHPMSLLNAPMRPEKFIL